MKEVFSIYWQALSGSRRRAALLALISGAAGCLEGVALLTLIPLLNGALSLSRGEALDWPAPLAILGGSSTQMVLLALGVFGLLGVLSALVKFVADSSILRLRAHVEEILRVRMTEVLIGMEWTAFLSHRLGDINKAITVEGHQIAYGVASFVNGIGAFLVSVVFFVLAMFVSLKMTLFALLFAFLAAVGYHLIGKRASEQAKSLSPCVTSIGEQSSDVFGNLKFFRATGLVSQASAKAKKTYRNYAETYFKSLVNGTVMRLFFEISGIALIVLYLGFSILIFKQPFAECFVFLALFYRLAPRVLAANNCFFESRVHTSWFLTWKERFDRASASQEHVAGGERPIFEDRLNFESVSFSYPSTDKAALRELSLSIGRKECLAIVGESGSGKSTLVDLVTGLMVPQEGSISLGDVSFQDIDMNAWRSGIGLVLQDSPLFHTTVLENIAFGDRRPDLERAKFCARLAHALDFIEKLPLGFHASLGEKGARLSGGERQRIALARALYRNPWLLVLDEATSALDGESEARIQEALEGLKGEFAILMIAHRLKTVQMADKIAVLSEGEVVECGTWDELLSKPNGKFYKMAELQGLTPIS